MTWFEILRIVLRKRCIGFGESALAADHLHLRKSGGKTATPRVLISECSPLPLVDRKTQGPGGAEGVGLALFLYVA